MRTLACLTAVLVFGACGNGESSDLDDAGTVDAGALDGGEASDAGEPDAGEEDAGVAEGQRPTTRITSPDDTARGVVTLAYSYADTESDTVDITFEYLLDGEDEWMPATPAPSSKSLSELPSNPIGTNRTFDWWSVRDAGKGNFLGLKLRVTASDAGGPGEPAESDAFDLLNGVYMHKISAAAGADARSAATGDLDGDGFVDIVLATSQGAQLLLNDGNGFFGAAPAGQFPNEAVSVAHVAIEDFTGDGHLDVAVAVTQVMDGGNRRNRLYVGDGEGGFSNESDARMPDTDDQSERVLPIDADGDGDLDLFVVNSGSQRDELFLNDGDGNFTDVTDSHMPDEGNMGASAAVGDFDGDGDPDVVIVNFITSQGFRMYVNDGDGIFSNGTNTRMPAQREGGLLLDVSTADIDGDGDLDLYMADSMTDGPMLFNDGFGVFEYGPKNMNGEVTPINVGGLGGVAACFIDTNLNGYPELFVSKTSRASMLFDNRYPNGTFQKAPSWRFADDEGQHRGCVVADFDNDSDPDLFVATAGTEPSEIWFNDEWETVP